VVGEIGLAPSEFYALSYCELRLIMEGYRERQKKEIEGRRELGAWILQWLLLPYKKEDADPITIDTLLGRKPKGKKKAPAMTREQAKAKAAKLWEAYGREFGKR
jgi:hypothetical protein